MIFVTIHHFQRLVNKELYCKHCLVIVQSCSLVREDVCPKIQIRKDTRDHHLTFPMAEKEADFPAKC